MPNAKFISSADWTAAPEVDVTDGEDLFPQVAAGTYYPILSSTTSIVVPQLTAGSIDNASPTEGDTLTVTPGNETVSATYQWQKDGVDIVGATLATLDTTGEGAGDYRRGVSDGVQGPVYTAAVTVGAADVTAPVLTSPTDAADGATASTGSVSTDEGNGTLYWVVTTSATAPTAAQVKLGQDNSGTAADGDSGSQAVSGTGVQTLSPAPSGMTASTAYTTHFMHEDSSGNQSTVSSASGFTTGAASGVTLVNTGSAAYSDVPDLTVVDLTIAELSSAAAGDVVVVAFTGRRGGAGVPAVTVGGIAATARVDDSPGFGDTSIIYTMTVPGGGLASNIVNIDATSAGGAMSWQTARAYILRNAVEVPHDTASHLDDTSPATINTPADGYMIGAAQTVGNAAAAHTYSANLTRDQRSLIGSSVIYSYASAATTAGTGVTVSCDMSSTDGAVTFATFAAV